MSQARDFYGFLKAIEHVKSHAWRMGFDAAVHGANLENSDEELLGSFATRREWGWGHATGAAVLADPELSIDEAMRRNPEPIENPPKGAPGHVRENREKLGPTTKLRRGFFWSGVQQRWVSIFLPRNWKRPAGR